MTDIVERLRYADRSWPPNLDREAADEIERLRHALEQTSAELEHERQDNDTKDAEIKRLRNANRILRLGIVGVIDSGDAMDLARIVQSGDAVDWSKFPNGSLRKYVGLYQAYDEDLGEDAIRKMTE